jgi:hypothetical protein
LILVSIDLFVKEELNECAEKDKSGLQKYFQFDLILSF